MHGETVDQRPDPASLWSSFVCQHRLEIDELSRGVAWRSRQRGGSEEDDDLTQEVFLRLLAKAAAPPTFGSVGERRCYLRRVIESVAIDRARARGAVKRGGGDGAAQRAGAESRRCTRAGTADFDPEWVLLRRERVLGTLDACVDQTSARLRPRNLRIVWWAWVEGYNSREISSRLAGELSPSSVDSLLSRSRQSLRRLPAVCRALDQPMC